MTLTFVVALLGASVVEIRPGSSAADWASILVGAALAAAMTGIAAAILQFLPQRLFVPAAAAGGVAVALCVSALLDAGEGIWLRPIAAVTTLVWAGASIVALMVTRRAGVRLPPLRPS
jgi:hypothetical protein